MTNYYIPGDDSEPVFVSSLRASVVRTAVPVIVGALVTLALKARVELDTGVVTQAVSTVVTVVYYAIVRTLETRVGPAFGWLLGIARVPQYPA